MILNEIEYKIRGESECELAGPLLRKGSDVLVVIFILNQTVDDDESSLRWAISVVNADHLT